VWRIIGKAKKENGKVKETENIDRKGKGRVEETEETGGSGIDGGEEQERERLLVFECADGERRGDGAGKEGNWARDQF
jgi:hypothetical protein